MIKPMAFNEKIVRVATWNGRKKDYPQTQFVADSTEDLADINETGSEYLNYPAGSCILDASTSDVYILNASQDEYVKI